MTRRKTPQKPKKSLNLSPITEYSRKLNELIPTASRSATEKIEATGETFKFQRGADGRQFKFDFWSFYFHKEMNRLAYNKGLRSWQ